MGYPEDTVGAIMDFEMVRVREDVTLEVVLRYLRRLQELPDHTDQIFVVDRDDKLQGTLHLSTLLVRDPENLVSRVMATDYLTLNQIGRATCRESRCQYVWISMVTVSLKKTKISNKH